MIPEIEMNDAAVSRTAVPTVAVSSATEWIPDMMTMMTIAVADGMVIPGDIRKPRSVVGSIVAAVAIMTMMIIVTAMAIAVAALMVAIITAVTVVVGTEIPAVIRKPHSAVGKTVVVAAITMMKIAAVVAVAVVAVMVATTMKEMVVDGMATPVVIQKLLN